MTGESKEDYRLINIRRRLRELLMGRRLSMNPEETGVVELADFGKRCEGLAAFAVETREQFGGWVETIAEELELAARLGALLETLPRTPERLDAQTRLLEEVARMADTEEEPLSLLSLSTLARAERDRFAPLGVTFEGTIADASPGMAKRGEVRRPLRRALLDHFGAGENDRPFPLAVSKDGTMRFSVAGHQIFVEPINTGELERNPVEPPDVRKALDMYEGTTDEGLKEFLLVKAVDEALAAVLAPRLGDAALLAKARALPTKPGKRLAIRPEAVQRPVEGWNDGEALRAAEKLAARRIGPEWARLPKGAYILRLFFSEDDQLAADLLFLGAALRRMEKGEASEGAAGRAVVALRSLLGLLG